LAFPGKALCLPDLGIECLRAPGHARPDGCDPAAQQAEKLPGELALGNSIYQLSEDSTADRCVELMRILTNACPNALSNDAKEKLLALQRN
jgi:hypothetical protein